MRIESVLSESLARSDHDGSHKPGHAGGDVHDITSSEVHHTVLKHETVSVPAGVSNRAVDSHMPDGYREFKRRATCSKTECYR